MILPVPFIAVLPMLALESVPVVLGIFAACGGVGGLLGGYAAYQARQDASRQAEGKYQADILQAAHAAMTEHMGTLSADNRALRKDLILVRMELVGVNEQLRKCQDDKADMARENFEWQQRWEERHGHTDQS